MRKTLVVTVFALAPLLTASGDEKKQPKEPEPPIAAKLVAKKATYSLDLGGKTADEFKKMLKEAEKSGRTPPAPGVDLVLELTNTSKDITVEIWVEGNNKPGLYLELKGPGAVTVAGAPTLEEVAGVETALETEPGVKLTPGKSTTVRIESLSHGSRKSYWTEPGEYTLGASYTTLICVEKGDNRRVTITAAPVKLKVEGK